MVQNKQERPQNNVNYTYFTYCSGVSINKFQQVIATWVSTTQTKKIFDSNDIQTKYVIQK